LTRYLRMSDHSGNDPGDNVLSDALEAIFGAIYLDSGFAPCASVITRLYGDRVAHMVEPPQDPKTALQEWAQARGLPVPEYIVVEKSGPDHAPAFVIEVRVAGQAAQQGIGASRKAAEKIAAQKLLDVVCA
jgi:ribonuclease III